MSYTQSFICFFFIASLGMILGEKIGRIEHDTQDIHCPRLQAAYDDGYQSGYCDGADDGQSYENASNFSDDLITHDLTDDHVDNNPFE